MQKGYLVSYSVRGDKQYYPDTCFIGPKAKERAKQYIENAQSKDSFCNYKVSTIDVDIAE